MAKKEHPAGQWPATRALPAPKRHGPPGLAPREGQQSSTAVQQRGLWLRVLVAKAGTLRDWPLKCWGLT